MKPATSPLALAYLCSRYPAVSHTFVEREVRAVRAQGIVVHTFSVRAAEGADLLGERHAAEAKTTTVLLSGLGALALAQVCCFLRSPFRYLGAAAQAFRYRAGGRGLVRSLAYLFEAARLCCAMRSRGVRHVHVHLANNAAFVALLARRLDATLSYSLSLHGPLDFLEPKADRLSEKIAGATFVRCISSFARSQAMTFSPPALWNHFTVVHCGVPSAAPSTDETVVDVPRVVSVGRLVPEKGWPIFVEACEALARRNVRFQVDVVGDGPVRSSLEVRAKSLPANVTLRFHGARSADEVQELLAKADVFALASFQEGLPVVLMEAMARAVPVVTTHIAGIPELVQSGKNGLLVPAGNVDAFAEALYSLLVDATLRRHLGDAGRATVEAQFLLEDSGHAMAQLFRRYVKAL